MAVIKNIKRETKIQKEMIFNLDTIVEELAKKYRMNSPETEAVWETEYKDAEGNDLGTCLILRGVSVPKKKAAAPVEETPVEDESAE